MRQTTGLSATRHLYTTLGLALFLKELAYPGLKLRLAQCVQPDLFLAAFLEFGDITTTVEHFDLAALLGHLGSQRFGLFLVNRVVSIHHHAAALGTLKKQTDKEAVYQ